MEDEILLFDLSLPITNEDINDVRDLMYLSFLLEQHNLQSFYPIEYAINRFLIDKERLLTNLHEQVI